MMGSGEFEPWTEESDRFLMSRATGDGSVAILPLASAPEGRAFADWAHKGLEHYDSMGVPARVIEVKCRDDAFREDLVSELVRSSLIFFSGGNPAFLADAVAGTPLLGRLVEAVDRGAALAGCSAGACMMGEAAPESMTENVENGLWVSGLRFVPNAWIFPHWDALDSYQAGLRAFFLRAVPPGGCGIGIDEQTVMVSDGDRWRVFGRGRVTLAVNGEQRAFDAGETLDVGEFLPHM